jgi:uncharacterized protein (DUF2147 family)
MKKNTIMRASAIVATAVMAAAANGVTASAAESRVPKNLKRSKKSDVVSVETIELSDAQAVAGKTVAVQMSMDTNDECVAYEILIEYDPSLKFERVIGANAFDVFDNYIAVVGYGATPFKDDKPVVTLNFEVPEDAEAGDSYEVKFSEIRNFSNFDENFENFESFDGKIEVLEETKRCPDYMVFEKVEDGNIVETKPGLRGDANNDGVVNVRDAAAIARHCANSYSGVEVIDTEEGKYFGNVDEDKSLSVKDAASISRYLSNSATGKADWDNIIK